MTPRIYKSLIPGTVFFALIIVLVMFPLTSCGNRSAPSPTTKSYNLPGIRYFESTPVDNNATKFVLYNYDLETNAREEIWSITDEKIDRVEITPDGVYVLVHYSDLDQLAQYYDVYNVESVTAQEPMVFIRDMEEITHISAYQAFLNFATYKYGFVIGDPDFKAINEDIESETYKFAWVNLTAGVVEEIPLLTQISLVPNILFVPSEGGSMDFMQKGSHQILRLDWFTTKTSLMAELYNPEKDPFRRLTYLGSFSHFGDFLPPNPTNKSGGTMKVGLRTKDGYEALSPGEFPVWALWDKYILIRVFPEDVMDMILSGADPVETLGYMMREGVKSKFELWDVKTNEKREISLDLADPMALPHPVFDPLSEVMAVAEVPPIQQLSDGNPGSTTTSIVVFSIPDDEPIAMITGVPTKDKDVGMAFFRPIE